MSTHPVMFLGTRLTHDTFQVTQAPTDIHAPTTPMPARSLTLDEPATVIAGDAAAWSLDTDAFARRAQQDTGHNMAALRSSDRALFLHLRAQAKRRLFCEALGLDDAATA